MPPAVNAFGANLGRMGQGIADTGRAPGEPTRIQHRSRSAATIGLDMPGSSVASLGRRWRALLRFWVAHLWLGLASLALGVAGVVAVAVLAPERPDPANPGKTQIYGWGLAAALLCVVPIMVGILSLVARTRESRLQRIERLGSALQEAERIIAEINRDMKEGAERLAELEAACMRNWRT
jgi:hypothetical protein